MNTKKVLYIVGGLTVAYVGLRYAAQFLNVQGSSTSGVTASTKGDVKTTPIKTGQVAFVAPFTTLSLLANRMGDSLRKLVPSSQTNVPSNAVSTPYNNPQSARAAATSPKRVDYSPSGYAILKPRGM